MSVSLGAVINQQAPQPQPVYAKYPMVMVHPLAFKAGTNTDHLGNQIGHTVAPADRFPPVTVLNPEQEAWHAAQGYVPGGSSDVDAFNRAVAGSSVTEAKPFAEWPKWIDGTLYKDEADYKAKGAPPAPEGAVASTNSPGEAAALPKKPRTPKQIAAAKALGERAKARAKPK